MSYPENPRTIVIQNNFYPQGIQEIDIWNYYQSVKREILRQSQNRDMMFFIMVDKNKSIVRRRGKDNKVIRLNPSNYDKLITGRTVSLHTAMGPIENFGIIDIDIDSTDGFKWAKEVTRRVYDFVMDKMPIVRTASIRFTGKNSFHIKCDFGRRMNIDTVRFLLGKFLRDSELSKVYTIEGKRRPGIPNLDMAPNKLRGNYITLNSLSVLGLRCMEVPYTSLMSFNPNRAKIK